MEENVRPEPNSPDRTWSVSGLLGVVSGVLDEIFGGDIWVEGEIRNLSRPSSGHVYFTLVDPGPEGGTSAQIRVTLFKWNKEKVNLRLRQAHGQVRMDDGVRVRVRCRLGVYPARGDLQLNMVAIDPTFTLGVLASDRAAVLARLEAGRLLDLNGSLPVDPVPLRLAVITSIGSAAAADFLHELEVSRLPFDVALIDTRVQGSDATPSIVHGLAVAAGRPGELIALVRGGGARTDLAAFDHWEVAAAIARSPVPVWTGIGHEVDRTIADEVAHTAHKTPTAAAAAVVARVGGARAECERLAQRLGIAATGALHRASATLDRAETVLVRTPALLARAAGRLDLIEARLAGHDPRLLLERGWSLVRTATGRTLTTVAQISPGDPIHITLADGRITALVEAVDPPTTSGGPSHDTSP